MTEVNIVKVTNADGKSISYTYDAANRLTSYVDVEGYTHAFVYDPNGNIIAETDGNGNTTHYTYDALNRRVGKTDANGNGSSVEYDADGRLLKVVDEEGAVTQYVYDDCNRVTKMTDALGNSTAYTYDEMDRVLTVTDARGGVTSYTYTDQGDVATVTDAEGYTISYEYDGNHNMVKKTTMDGDTTYVYNPLDRLISTTTPDGKSESNTYDGNGNLVKTTDADGFVTEYTYSALDLVENINYNGGKQVDYAYNKTGDLVEMTDWTGTTTFELDLLHRITATTDRLGQHVSYTYDEVGNQTSVAYPDGTTATKEYDLVHNLTKVVEEDGRTTSYTYDGMARLTHMDYPDGWQEDYTYDAIGQLLSIYDTDPSGKDMKQQKNIFEYDDCGNMTHEYMRGNGTGEATTEVFYTYDALHRVTSAKENYGNAWRNYVYDSLGNLTYEENSNNVHYDYKLNNLNQVTEKTYGTNDKERTIYTYDSRGNLILEEYAKNNGNGNRSTVAEYTYDETNRMVKGENGSGESSSYFFNGLGALVQQTWVIAKNGYGYHDVQADEDDVTILTADVGIMLFANGNGNGNGNGSGDKPTGSTVNNTSTVVKQFVIDYTVETLDPLAEHEVNGLDYRYVYGFQNLRLSVNISPIDSGAGSIVETGTMGEQIRLYYHQDLRGTVDYLTSPTSGKVESWTHYNEWGEITHNAVVKCGYREFDLVKNYTGHEYDAVLNLYYAKARMYDAENRRFTSVDPILDASRYDLREYVTDTMRWVQYLYVKDNAVNWIDPLGLVEYIPLYINGTLYENMAFVENGVIYISYQQSRQFSQAADFGKVSSEIVGRRKITYPPRAVHEIGSVPIYAHTYVAGDQTFYYTKFDCEEGVPLRDIANAEGVGHTISWWNEDGVLNVLNTLMKNSPVSVVREGNQVYITVYAEFLGDDANKPYNNTIEAYHRNRLDGREHEPKNYTSYYTYAELVAMSTRSYWSGPYTPTEVDYLGDLGPSGKLIVTVNFYGKTKSQNDYIQTGNPSKNQEYLSIYIDTDTPDVDNKERERSEVKMSKKIVDGNSIVYLYDHWYDDKNGEYTKEEFTVGSFYRTAAHEFGHVFGIGDAYPNSYHGEFPVTSEVPSYDLMRTIGSDATVTSNDIEMLLLAWKLNARQEFVTYSDYTESVAIKLHP